ncbi:MAG: KUP/HAK/KT family potassium transporter [Bacteroidales bacterium]|jgi:KUP system potassium uptake protein|nr:KUP/HAK/KT family potassium transporter [Bacteroidales bacterium]
MKKAQAAGPLSKLSMAGLLITLGIVYGDLGTSPLYTLRAMLNGAAIIDRDFILGALSCIFWTLTLQTTVKYILITLRADNKGEGGIMALFALLKKRKNWLYLVAIVGGCALLADGIITPAITVTSAIEGLRILKPGIPVVTVVFVILSVLFFIQQFGTAILGKSFGPLMLFWFSMIGVLGLAQLIRVPEVLLAVNPYYAIKLLSVYPNGFLLLGAVFLCTTGAEALYSDLGHCGVRNIRISWIYVKMALLLNYFGQGAWIIRNAQEITPEVNPFYAIMPEWFLVPGILVATAAAIIASQALISGSFTIISEAISLNFFPKVRISYPSSQKGQMFIPLVNVILYLGCCFVVFYFRKSSGMEAAYGLAINLAMLATTVLLMFYLKDKFPLYLRVLCGVVFFAVELSFLSANLFKFSEGGWITIMFTGLFALVMYVWTRGRRIKNSFISYVKIKDYLPVIKDLSSDETVPRYATNLVYITHANRVTDIENKILYSILRKQPKRADTYWLLHVDILDEPHVKEYEVMELIPGVLIRIDLRMGYKVPVKASLYFHNIVFELMAEHKIDMISSYPSLKQHNVLSDFRYVVIDRVPNKDYEFSHNQKLIMNLYFRISKIGMSDVRYLGLDVTNVNVEMVPLLAHSEIIYNEKQPFQRTKDPKKIHTTDIFFTRVRRDN